MSEQPYLAAPADEIYWRETKPDSTAKMLLLTVGGTCVVGNWYGEFGEYFIGWSPMPKRITQHPANTPQTPSHNPVNP